MCTDERQNLEGRNLHKHKCAKRLKIAKLIQAPGNRFRTLSTPLFGFKYYVCLSRRSGFFFVDVELFFIYISWKQKNLLKYVFISLILTDNLCGNIISIPSP